MAGCVNDGWETGWITRRMNDGCLVEYMNV